MKLITACMLFIFFLSLNASTQQEESAASGVVHEEVISQESAQDYTQEQKRWYKRGMFWFGCMNGLVCHYPMQWPLV